jgi:hypothetical protein
MVIVEGMDNSGKTTLVQEIAGLGARIVPSVGKPDREQARLRMQELLNETDAKVYDRFVAFSDEVYGRVLRGCNILDPDAYGAMLRVMRANALVIYCRPPDDVILNFGDRAQMEGVLERGSTLIRGYDRLFNLLEDWGYAGQIIRYDWTFTSGYTKKQILERVKAHLAIEAENHAYINQLNKGALCLG